MDIIKVHVAFVPSDPSGCIMFALLCCIHNNIQQPIKQGALQHHVESVACVYKTSTNYKPDRTHSISQKVATLEESPTSQGLLLSTDGDD